jgi:hypothetical protein
MGGDHRVQLFTQNIAGASRGLIKTRDGKQKTSCLLIHLALLYNTVYVGG